MPVSSAFPSLVDSPAGFHHILTCWRHEFNQFLTVAPYKSPTQTLSNSSSDSDTPFLPIFTAANRAFAVGTGELMWPIMGVMVGIIGGLVVAFLIWIWVELHNKGAKQNDSTT